MPKQVKVGKYQSRGLWTQAKANHQRPAVILIPGSGANGPEEMIPAQMTVDHKDHSIFQSLSRPFIKEDWNVLCLGKPGIEFHSGWDPAKLFYDKETYMHLRWEQLIENLAEGIKFLKQQKSVDPKRIYILGHSQGTQISIDYVTDHPEIAGLILLGYSGEDYKTILDWQFFKRPIEHFISTDVDKDKDGFVSKEDVIKWPGPFDFDDSRFDWNFRSGKDKISLNEIEEDLRKNPDSQKIIKLYKESTFLAKGLYDRGPIYKKTASVKAPIYIFTGELDLLTPPREALEAKKACDNAGKKDCEVNIVPGLGHGFSPPRGPRKHPLLDITVGPVEESFLQTLEKL